MKRPDRSCRLVDAQERACRRPKTHVMHAEHVAGCHVPAELHHEYVPARKAFGRFKADPFVRTSLLIRKSSLDYLKQTFGEMAPRIRELVAADQGVTAARMRHYIGDPIAPRKVDGTFQPKGAEPTTVEQFTRELEELATDQARDRFTKLVCLDDPYVPPEQRPDPERVKWAFEEMIAITGIDPRVPLDLKPMSTAEEMVEQQHREAVRTLHTVAAEAGNVAPFMDETSALFYEGVPTLPMDRCSVREYPHDHVLCISDDEEVEL